MINGFFLKQKRSAEELDKTGNIKNSHRGILSINDSAPMNKKSTYNDNYYEKDVSQIEESQKGSNIDMLGHQFVFATLCKHNICSSRYSSKAH
jgi:hypothetical protein